MNKNIRGIQVSRKSDFVNIGLEVDDTGELFMLQVNFIKNPLNGCSGLSECAIELYRELGGNKITMVMKH